MGRNMRAEVAEAEQPARLRRNAGWRQPPTKHHRPLMHGLQLQFQRVVRPAPQHSQPWVHVGHRQLRTAGAPALEKPKRGEVQNQVSFQQCWNPGKDWCVSPIFLLTALFHSPPHLVLLFPVLSPSLKSCCPGWFARFKILTSAWSTAEERIGLAKQEFCCLSSAVGLESRLELTLMSPLQCERQWS